METRDKNIAKKLTHTNVNLKLRKIESIQSWNSFTGTEFSCTVDNCHSGLAKTTVFSLENRRQVV